MKIKERIISRVNEIDDPKLLEEILRVLDLDSRFDEIYTLTSAEQTAVSEGIKDADEGKVYTQSEARAFVRQWQSK